VLEVVGNFVEPVEGSVGQGAFACSRFPSFSCNQQYGVSGESNDHFHYIKHKGYYFEGYCSSFGIVDHLCFPHSGFDYQHSNFPLQEGFVLGGFPLSLFGFILILTIIYGIFGLIRWI